MEDADTLLLETLIGIAFEAGAAARQLEKTATVLEPFGTPPDSVVTTFQRHCVKSKEALSLLLTGRSAQAALLLKAADLSDLLTYLPSASTRQNPTPARFDGARYTNDFGAIEASLQDLRRKTGK